VHLVGLYYKNCYNALRATLLGFYFKDVFTKYTDLIDMWIILHNAVGIVTRLWVGRSGLRFLVGARDLFFSQNANTVSGGPLSFLLKGVPDLKRPYSEVDHSPSTSAKVKNEWIYSSTSLSDLYRGHGQIYL